MSGELASRPSAAAVLSDLRRFRGQLGLTQEQLAGRLGVSTITVHRWESGQSTPRPIAAEKLVELAEDAASIRAASSPMRGLRPASRPSTPTLDLAADHEAVLAVAEALRLAYGHQFNPAFAAETSRIHPLLHQRFAVYERMLGQDPLRFLLADDAGAGKTIMTGLYIREMLSQGRLKRVLIVPPAGLVGNWRRELATLFRLDFRIVTGADARTGNPFSGLPGDRVIVSLDTLAGEGAFSALREADGAAYDLVVFDEAHKLSVREHGGSVERTTRYQLAEALAVGPEAQSRFAGLGWTARHVLLLTATPHMGKAVPYAWLWRLLDHEAFGAVEAVRRASRGLRDRHFLRRTKEEMVGLDGRPLYPPRDCDTFGFELSQGDDGEQALYDSTTRYLEKHYGRGVENRPAVELAKTVFQRRLASSTWALLRSFERRHDKLVAAAEALESGQLTADVLERGQRELSEKYREDYFDQVGADEDAAAEGWAEASQEYEDAVLGAVAAVGAEELRREAESVARLADRARRLVESGRETKFERLRGVLESPEHRAEKWLVFSEHRDTVDHLARRLDGLGYGGLVAHIHGGMDWRERERQVEFFRRVNGARFMVATDAAGEGINLQFCHLMANYDIPWNPARLEQRMGRIHRYGQRQDVRVANLVATSTREGRVLAVLLEKLKEMRADLDSDKVFDVIGRMFAADGGESLTRVMAGATDAAGERRAVERISTALNAGRIKRLGEEEARVYGVPEQDVTGATLRAVLEKEPYLELLPSRVRSLVERGARLLDLQIRGDLDDRFALAAMAPGALDALLPALEKYPAEARDRLTVRRPEDDEFGVWLHPGEPLFDALCGEVRSRHAADALRGAIFVDQRAKAPALIHLAEVWVEEVADGQTGAGDAAGRREVERRLVAIEQREGAPPRECPVEKLFLMPPSRIAPGTAPLAARALDLRAEATAFLDGFLEGEVRQHRQRREAALPERRRRVAMGFDLRLADLAVRRGKLARRGSDADGRDRDELDLLKREQRAVQGSRQLALNRLAAEPSRVVPGGHRFLLHALAVRPEDVAGLEHVEAFDEPTERIAVRIGADWETSRGARVQDVSTPELARRAGHPDWPGFDLLSGLPSGEKRCIEVKGRAGRSSVSIESNEWKQACQLGEGYWLYVVFDCATPAPSLWRIRDPWSKLFANERARSVFNVPVGRIEAAAER